MDTSGIFYLIKYKKSYPKMGTAKWFQKVLERGKSSHVTINFIARKYYHMRYICKQVIWITIIFYCNYA